MKEDDEELSLRYLLFRLSYLLIRRWIVNIVEKVWKGIYNL